MKKPLLSTLLKTYEEKSLLLPYELALINEVIEPIINTRLAFDGFGEVVVIQDGETKHFDNAEAVVDHLRTQILDYNKRHNISEGDYEYESYTDRSGNIRRRYKYIIERDETGTVVRRYRARNFANILRSSNR